MRNNKLKMFIAFAGCVMGLASKTWAADYRCYTLRLTNMGSEEQPLFVRGVVVARVEREGRPPLELRNNLIAVSEAADDFLSSAKDGERICVKGDHQAHARQIYVYDAKRE